LTLGSSAQCIDRITDMTDPMASLVEMSDQSDSQHQGRQRTLRRSSCVRIDFSSTAILLNIRSDLLLTPQNAKTLDRYHHGLFSLLLFPRQLPNPSFNPKEIGLFSFP
jgi:hypothetical protein